MVIHEFRNPASQIKFCIDESITVSGHLLKTIENLKKDLVNLAEAAMKQSCSMIENII